MVFQQKKNFLRDILPKHSGGASFPSNKIKGKSDVIYHKVSEEPIEYNHHRGKSNGKWRIWLVAIVAVIVLTISIFYVFSSAEVLIVPRTDEVKLSKDLKAVKEKSTETKETNLVFTPSLVEKIGSKIVDADGEKMVERKASGTITIFNRYSDKEQRLIKNTRFETTDGLIYKIDRSVVVPGRTVVGGEIVSGSIDAVVYADEPGEKFNIGLSDFTIPGFRSDAGRYSGFYARSKTPMLEGYSGIAKYVSDAKQKLIRAEIRSELEKQIVSEAEVSIDKKLFIPKGAHVVEFETLPSTDSTDGKIILREKAKIIIYSFKIENWDNFLASQAPFASSMGSSTVGILNREDMVFNWRVRPKLDSEEISFSITGTAKFAWLVDENKLAVSLAGEKRSEIKKILSDYDSILEASASLTPFWRTSFPKDYKKIKFVIKLPE